MSDRDWPGEERRSGVLYRWQGEVDTEIKELKRRCDGHDKDGEDVQKTAELTLKEIGALRVEIAVLKVRVAAFATIGSVFGAGVVSLAVSLLTKGHG